MVYNKNSFNTKSFSKASFGTILSHFKELESMNARKSAANNSKNKVIDNIFTYKTTGKVTIKTTGQKMLSKLRLPKTISEHEEPQEEQQQQKQPAELAKRIYNAVASYTSTVSSRSWDNMEPTEEPSESMAEFASESGFDYYCGTEEPSESMVEFDTSAVAEVFNAFDLARFSTEDFEDNYELGEQLGEGAFAIVRDGFHKHKKDDDDVYAIKIIEKEGLYTASEKEALMVEIAVMQELIHPNVVRLYEAYQDADCYYLVLEKIMGGELLDRLILKESYNEKEARDTCKILFETIEFCHSRKIAHRDLKLENLLLKSDDDDTDVKIADFGLAKKLMGDEKATTFCGSPGYVAPEIIDSTPYDWQVDIWSMGVIVYILLGGYSPFEENDQKKMYDRILQADYEFHEQYWKSVSDEAKDFISKLLNNDPDKRLTASQALQHRWMTAQDQKLANQDLGANLVELQRFSAKRKFRAAVGAVIATQKFMSQSNH